jgi:hypothetical protein
VSLYLDLMKKAVTGTLYGDEPDRNDPDFERWRRRFVRHYFESHAAHTCVPLVRLHNVEACARTAIEEAIPGDFVETGVWRGGTVIFMRAILKELGVEDRLVWAADSFEGLPAPDPVAFPKEAYAHNTKEMKDDLNFLAVSFDEVKANFARYGLLDDQVRFLVGWFSETLPVAPIERIALLRLDGDYYQSTMDALSSLYDKVSPGGFVIVDDYGEDTWTYCREAVDEFRAARGIGAEMKSVDRWCWYWRKP